MFSGEEGLFDVMTFCLVEFICYLLIRIYDLTNNLMKNSLIVSVDYMQINFH